MNDLEKYAAILNEVFGPGTSTFDTAQPTSNHVIGALNFVGDFEAFKVNFKARLTRLRDIYAENPDYLREIKVQANEIANPSNWEGAFAELATYDHFNKDILARKQYLYTPIKPNVTIPATRTFAAEFGKVNANLDGQIEQYDVYFDVKRFADVVGELLKGVYESLYLRLGRNDFMIGAEHSLDVSYNEFQQNRTALLEELVANIEPNETTYYRSTVIPNLNFRLNWGRGILTVERSYHPYRHAVNLHKTAFNYANKFVKDRPSFIVLVIFPWYNNVVTDFHNGNVEFFRAFARRVFCGYRYDAALFTTFDRNFTGTHTMLEVSQNLSGIVFLEDRTITGENPEDTNVKAHVYVNPNAVNPLYRSLAMDFLIHIRNGSYDDFEYDNY